MDLVEWLITGTSTGAFLYGIWYMLIRNDDRSMRSRTLDADAVTSSRTPPNFSKALSVLDRKLALVTSRLGEIKAREQSQKESDEEIAKKKVEDEARLKAEDEARLAKQLEEEDARKEAEYKAKREADLIREQLIAEQKEAERQGEEARLAAQIEEQRQAEMAALEEERLAEIESQKAAEELAARQVSDEAMIELKERLEREGAKSSDVQISLIWNNYNDLDLHVVCPSGERIHGGNRHSECSGELDVDANVRPETKKPVENVVWPEGKAPGGLYRAYVHHYKKHKKRKAKDPTKFKVIINAGGNVSEYESTLTHGDPIQLICEFTLESPEERAKLARVAQAKLKALEGGGLDANEILEQMDEDEARLAKQLEEEETRKQGESEAKREADLIRGQLVAEQKEADRLDEEARLAAQIEEQRQVEMAAQEEERLAEIESQKAAEELAARQVSDEAMKELKERLEREGAKSSDVQISLIWNNYNDLDLHVVCPSGERIHGGNRQSQCSGELDVDANVKPETKKPVENVVWPEGKAPGGLYRAYVHHYKKHKKRKAKDPTKFKVIINAGGNVSEYESTLTHGDPIQLICEFTLESPEERAKLVQEAKAKLKALESGEIDTNELLEESDESQVETQASSEPETDPLAALMDESQVEIQASSEPEIDPLAAFMDEEDD